jgi:hypothetical protein
VAFFLTPSRGTLSAVAQELKQAPKKNFFENILSPQIIIVKLQVTSLLQE